MPKQTFFNLAEDKRLILINAMKAEFSRVPLHEASIANIVQTAGIPRGSFYQYFEDKEEAYYFLLEQHSKENQEIFIGYLKQFDGDIFDAFIEMFQGMLKKFQSKENLSFFRNAFLNMNYKAENTLNKNINADNFNKHFARITDLINKDKLNISDERDVFHIMKILSAVTFQNLIHNFAKEIPLEEAIKFYTSEINLLKKGLYKGE